MWEGGCLSRRGLCDLSEIKAERIQAVSDMRWAGNNPITKARAFLEYWANCLITVKSQEGANKERGTMRGKGVRGGAWEGKGRHENWPTRAVNRANEGNDQHIPASGREDMAHKVGGVMIGRANDTASIQALGLSKDPMPWGLRFNGTISMANPRMRL
jgi:hypothetical protein